MRRIKRAEITFLSLVPLGANKQPVLFKQDMGGDLTAEIQTITKALEKFDEKGEILALGWVPNRLDAVGDYATKEAVEGMCHSFMKNGAKLDIRHNEKAVEPKDAYVAENFIVQKNDPRFTDWKDYDGKPVDATGSWAALVKIESPELRKLYREGKWNGVSFGSRDFELEPIRKEMPQGGTNMDFEKLLKALEEASAKRDAVLVKSITDALKPAAPPADDKKIVFKGDPTNLADVKRHAAELRKTALQSSVDFTSPDAVEALAKQLEAEAEERLKKETPEQRAERLVKENAALKVQLEKAQRTSTVPAADTTVPGETPSVESGLSKEDMAGLEIGKRIAKRANDLYGVPKPATK